MSLLGVLLVLGQAAGGDLSSFWETDGAMTEDVAVIKEDLWGAGDGKSRAARTAEILLTLSRFGFGELIERSWWSRWLPGQPTDGQATDVHEAGAVRLRRLFETLGPSFVKIGQLLALHAGALPLAYREELSQLLDSALPLPFSYTGTSETFLKGLIPFLEKAL